MKASLIVLGVLGTTFALPVLAIPVKVGNANDGRDLENLTPLTDGPIVEARAATIELLKKINTPGVAGLGTLLPEVEKSELFMAAEDVKASVSDDFRPDHLSNDGRVYARTMPEPYAPTRFFPVANALTRDQLVALHVHEALHRALPSKLREDEAIVARLTLAITGPGATYDRVAETAASVLPAERRDKVTNRELLPSQVGYQVRFFFSPDDPSGFEIKRAHLFQSYLYPFGSEDSPFGMGIEASIIERSDGPIAGPLGFSARLKVWSKRDFQVDLTGGVDLNTLSSEELENSPFGRDIYKLGVIVRKDFDEFYVENALEVSSGGESRFKIANVEYEYSFGTVVKPSVHAGVVLGQFHVGTYIDIFLSDHFRVNGGAFGADGDKGRYRIVALGPEAQYRRKNLILGVATRFLVDSTKDADFTNLGNVLDSWVGKGGIQLSAGYRF